MKKIGLIGGMSWESSAVYYQLLNREVGRILGGTHSCECLLDSVDFADVEELQHAEKWEELCELMKEKAMNLQQAGAEVIVLCTNTMHICWQKLTEDLEVEFLHIAEATAEEIKAQGLDKVGLLGTRFTMERDFYTRPLREKHQIEVIVPGRTDRESIHNCIYRELIKGIFSNRSRDLFKRIIEDLQKQGAQGVILGCTEIPLLIKQKDVSIPVFDTTAIHVKGALKMALGLESDRDQPGSI
jgi:aspartate racemase